MSLILNIETSGETCSVALHKDGKCVANRVVTEPQAHAKALATLVDSVFSETVLQKKELQAVAVSSGPGSYTGLRIGVSTAKGLCFGLNIPLIAIPTLELLVYQVSKKIVGSYLLCAMLDARRMEVYCMVSTCDRSVIIPTEARVIDSSSFSDLLEEHRVIFFGSGAKKCEAVIQHPNAYFIDGEFPNALFLGELSQQRYDAGLIENLAYFEPFYLKEFQTKKPGNPLT